MKKYLLLTVALLIAVALPGRAQLITGFGSLQLNPVIPATDFMPPWLATQATFTTTTLTVNGVSDSGGGFETLLTTPITLTDIDYPTLVLALSGELTAAAPSGSFNLFLFDDSLTRSAEFTFTWSSFTQTGVTTVTATNPVLSPGFDGKVEGLELSVGGTPGETVSFQFDTLTAVPEPSTYAMFAMGAVMLYFVHLRRKARVS